MSKGRFNMQDMFSPSKERNQMVACFLHVAGIIVTLHGLCSFQRYFYNRSSLFWPLIRITEGMFKNPSPGCTPEPLNHWVRNHLV